MKTPIEIPFQELSPDALLGIIEYFVLKEGTDYGTEAYSLEDKVAAVRSQLASGRAKILFHQEDGLCEIVLS